MNNKGYTLIEIIASILIIAIIGTIVVINIKKNPEKTLEKNENTIKEASSTYLAVNNKLLKEMEENEGYLILTIDELIDMGYLDEKIKEKLDFTSGYDKVILKKRDIDDITDIYNNDGEYEDIGLYDVIYPYVENSNEYLIIKEPLLFYKDTNYEINLINECKNLTNLSIFNKNYKKTTVPVSSTDYKCALEDSINIGGNIKYIKYSYGDYIGYREVISCGERDISYKYESKDEDYNGEWTNDNIIINSKIKEGTSDNSTKCNDYFKIKVNNGIEDLSENKINVSGTYVSKLYFDFSKNFLEESKKVELEKVIKIDKNVPVIDSIVKVGNKYEIKITDSESGINKIIVGENEHNLSGICRDKVIDGGYKDCILTINSADENKEISIKDAAGNEINTIDFTNAKSFSYSVIDSTKFKVILNGFDDDTFKLRYKYNETNKIELEVTGENSNKKTIAEIDLFDILNKCKENSSCKSQLASNRIFINKNSLDLQIEIGSMTFDFTVTLNIYFDKDLLGDSGYGYRFYILGVNDFGNILYNKYLYSDGAGRNNYNLFRSDTTKSVSVGFFWQENKRHGLSSCGRLMYSYISTDEKITFTFNNDNVISNNLSFSYWDMDECTDNDTLSISTKNYNIKDKSSKSTSQSHKKGHQYVYQLKQIYNSYTDDIMNKAGKFVDSEITSKKGKIISFWNSIKGKKDYYMRNPSEIDYVSGLDNFVYKDDSINYSFVSYCENSSCSTSKRSAYIKIMHFDNLEIN